MLSTSVTLLNRVRRLDDQAAWKRFVALYTPLLFRWARHAGLADDDAADLVQDVLLTLLREIPRFQYDAGRSFRGWLKTVTINKHRERQRKRTPAPLEPQVEAADDGNLAEFWEAEYRQTLVRKALVIMQAEFEPTTWRACWEHTVSGKTAAEVARELGLSEGAVYVAKSRVLRRLRQELAGLLE